MAITVRDILQLDILQGAHVAAGKNGLDNEVLRVNFTDCPLNHKEDVKLILGGDAFIRSFYSDRENEENIFQDLCFYINTGCSCCIALNEFVRQFSSRILKLADEQHFPIIQIDGSIPYASLIQDISALIIADQAEWITEAKINRLIHDDLSGEERAELFRQIAPTSSTEYVTIHVSISCLDYRRCQMLRQDITPQYGVRFLQYGKGGFLILPAGESNHPCEVLDSIGSVLWYYDKDYSVGVSCAAAGVLQFAESFRQALAADELGRNLSNRVMYYDELSVYKLLIPLRDRSVLKQFRDEILGPLEEQNLLETVRTYFSCEGDVKRTSSILDQHENTVRFRINKAKSVLGIEGNQMAFIECVSLALKSDTLLSGNTK